MTEEAAQAKRLFDGEKWSDAALALYRVVEGETGDDEGNKQIAQYHLAIALYRLKFYQASYGIFSRDRRQAEPPQVQRDAALAREARDRAARARRHHRARRQVQRASRSRKFNNPKQRDLYWQLNYLLGRYKYRNRQYDEALSLFDKVDRQ